MVYLHQEGLDLENGGEAKYAKLKIGAKIIPWSLETNNTKVTNLAMEAPYLSTQTVVERCPDSAPDEINRILKERGALISRNDTTVDSTSEKAKNIALNRNDIVRDNEDKFQVSQPEINT